MDQYERVKHLIERITYKPGWELSVSKTRDTESYPSPFDMNAVWLRVKFRAVDVNNPNKTVDLHNVKCFWEDTLQTMKDEDIIRHCICYLLMDTEKHELDEWLKFDGVQVFDPHPKGVMDAR